MLEECVPLSFSFPLFCFFLCRSCILFIALQSTDTSLGGFTLDMIRGLGAPGKWEKLSHQVREKMQNNILTSAVDFLKEPQSTHADGVDNILTPAIIEVLSLVPWSLFARSDRCFVLIDDSLPLGRYRDGRQDSLGTSAQGVCCLALPSLSCDPLD